MLSVMTTDLAIVRCPLMLQLSSQIPQNHHKQMNRMMKKKIMQKQTKRLKRRRKKRRKKIGQRLSVKIRLGTLSLIMFSLCGGPR